jgi:hypothetical protein
MKKKESIMMKIDRKNKIWGKKMMIKIWEIIKKKKYSRKIMIDD